MKFAEKISTFEGQNDIVIDLRKIYRRRLLGTLLRSNIHKNRGKVSILLFPKLFNLLQHTVLTVSTLDWGSETPSQATSTLRTKGVMFREELSRWM